MSNIRINDLPPDVAPNASDVVPIDGTSTRKATLTDAVNAGRPFASQSEAEAGTSPTKGMSPLLTAQAIAAIGGAAFASTARGIPAGGTTGQVLGKVNNTDYNVSWRNAGAGDMLASVYDPQGIAGDAFARSTQTGTQIAATISDFSTAADARVAAAVGVSVQAYDPDLTAWAGVNPSSYSTTAQIAAAYQPLDGDLTAIAALTTVSYGRNLLTKGAAADVRTYIGSPAYVADISALAALDPSKDKVAQIWNAGGRNGRLTFNSANLSSQVTADSNKYTYVAPTSDPTGAGGAWVYDSGLFVGKYPTPAIRSEREKMQDRADLRDWNGLDLTGGNDNASLFQAAVNAVDDVLYLPVGDIVLGSTITLPKFGSIRGKGPSLRYRDTDKTKSTILHFTHTGVGLLLTGSRAERTLEGFATMRDQPADGPGWTPLAADFDISIEGTYNAIVRNIQLYNPTKAIQIKGTPGVDGSGNIQLEGIWGQPFSVGLDATQCYDVLYLDHMHWWPYERSNPLYRRQNGVGYRFGKCDYVSIGRIFQWGMRTGFQFYNQATVGILPGGSINNLLASVVGFDNTEELLTTDAATSGAQFSIEQMIGGSDANPAAGGTSARSLINLAGANSAGYIGNLFGFNTNKSLIELSGTGNRLVVTNSRSALIDADADNDPEFKVATGNILMLGNLPSSSAPTVYSTTGTIRSPAWRNFTPTVTASSGTITTLGTLACKYKLEGTTLSFDLEVPITTNGTGAGVLQVTMPLPAKRLGSAGSGRGASANMLQATINSAVARLDIVTYNNLYPAADGATIRVSGQYEVA